VRKIHSNTAADLSTALKKVNKERRPNHTVSGWTTQTHQHILVSTRLHVLPGHTLSIVQQQQQKIPTNLRRLKSCQEYIPTTTDWS
jgi:hypothetical protein